MDDLFLLSFGDNDEIMSVIVSDINALIYSYRYEEAYELAKTHFENSSVAIYRQLYLLTKSLHNLYNEEYEKAIFSIEEAINLTTSLTGPLYTLNELRLVNMFLHINLVTYRLKIDDIIQKTFDNFTFYLQHNYVQSYREIGYMYLAVCEIFLYDLQLEKFRNLCLNCENIFKNNKFIEHQRICWMHMYIYHCIKSEYKEALSYYDKIKGYCDLFGNQPIELLNKRIEYFSNRLNRNIKPEAIMEVIANA
jgi:hypothetical protein